METGDPTTWTATRLAEAVRNKEIGSHELTTRYLDRIGSSTLNAVVTLDAERALANAAQRDDEIVRGEVRGPLHGLPMTIKDALQVAGMRCTGGAPELADHVPDTDAPVVAALRAAGAVIVGKTNLPRWSTDAQSSNELFGTTVNPWNPDLTPGGSSGGPAAAVAAGLTTAELGTDIAGSIRIPSHFCGVYGLKPSYGVVPSLGYVDHVGAGRTTSDINVVGPITRSAEDLDLMLGVLAGPSPRHRAAWRLELPGPGVTSLDGLRVAFLTGHDALPIDPQYAAVLERAADRLADAGARVTRPELPVDPAEQVELYIRLLLAAWTPTMDDEQQAIDLGGLHRDWLRAQTDRAPMIDAWSRWFDDGIDVLLCPVTFTTAFPHDTVGDPMSRTIRTSDGRDRPYTDIAGWLGLIGLVELPSAVAPVGTTETGMPAGVQVVAPFLHDRRAVAVAGMVADACGGGYRVPPRH